MNIKASEVYKIARSSRVKCMYSNGVQLSSRSYVMIVANVGNV